MHREVISLDIDDELILTPNNGAYERPEIRHGLPLNYVSEKIGSAVESAYRSYHWLKDRKGNESPDDLEHQQAIASIWDTFRCATTAFLALHNMLGLIQDPDKFNSLLKLSPKRFGAWLAMVRREGSISGYTITGS